VEGEKELHSAKFLISSFLAVIEHHLGKCYSQSHTRNRMGVCVFSMLPSHSMQTLSKIIVEGNWGRVEYLGTFA